MKKNMKLQKMQELVKDMQKIKKGIKLERNTKKNE